MAYPPTIPPATRVDATPQATNHPNDHNQISRALTDIVNELGQNPSDGDKTVQKRLHDLEVDVDGKLEKAGGTMTGVLTLDAVDAAGASAAMRREWIRDHHVNVEGDAMTGDLQVGGRPLLEEPGVVATSTGIMRSCIGAAGSDYPNLYLERLTGGGADNAGEQFIKFLRQPSAGAGGVTVSTISIGSPTDRIVISNCTVTAPSDYRMKERVGPISDASRRITELARRTFRGRWKSGGSELDMLSAHDIAEVAPYAVTGEKDGAETQQVDFAGLVPLLISALGDALNRIEVLEAG